MTKPLPSLQLYFLAGIAQFETWAAVGFLCILINRRGRTTEIG